MVSVNPFRAKKEVVEAPAKKTAVKKKSPAPKIAPTVELLSPISVEQRFFMISEAAYYIAEKNGFAAESELNSWLEAEKEIDAQILN